MAHDKARLIDLRYKLNRVTHERNALKKENVRLRETLHVTRRELVLYKDDESEELIGHVIDFINRAMGDEG